jgi:FMN-dependent NADH-azoreductase
MKLLHIIATPRHHVSNTLTIANCLIDSLRQKYPDLEVKNLDLFEEDLPAVAGDAIEAKYSLLSHIELDELKRQSWSMVENQIFQFLSADMYVISAPMWNFSIPYVLKFYLDTIVQPNYMFRYTATGVEGMVKNKKMVVVSARGGDYSPASPMHVMDFHEPYLRALFNFVGITDLQFVTAQPTDVTPELREIAINNALSHAQQIAAVM